MEKAKTGVKWVALTSEGQLFLLRTSLLQSRRPHLALATLVMTLPAPSGGDMDADGLQTMVAAASSSAPAYPT
jgi:hypothetical protein